MNSEKARYNLLSYPNGKQDNTYVRSLEFGWYYVYICPEFADGDMFAGILHSESINEKYLDRFDELVFEKVLDENLIELLEAHGR